MASCHKQLVLRGKAIECFSLIGMAVGKELFRAGKKEKKDKQKMKRRDKGRRTIMKVKED